MDPGRKRWEDREIELVAVDETFISPQGIRWKVHEINFDSLNCYRLHNGIYHWRSFTFSDNPTLKCEVERGPTH